MKILLSALITCLLILTVSCNSTKIASTWKADGYTSRTYKQFIVWAIVSENDTALKRKMEKHLAGDLREAGYNAVSATDIYGPKNYSREQEEEVVSLFKKSGVDALVTLILLDKSKETNFYPPGITYIPGSDMGYNYAGRYLTDTYQKIYSPGYYATDTKYFWEGNLYSMKEEKLVYIVKTNSFNPASIEKLAHENGKMIINNMIRSKIILNLKPPE
jgi:hypothetical protein